jgi:hypothetical protein
MVLPVLLLLFMLFVFLLQHICADGANYRPKNSPDNSAAGLVAYETATCAANQCCAQAFLAGLPGSLEP